jgi:OHCU decarboxylase
MTQEDFVNTFGRLFQGPSWVVENAYTQRPFEDTHALRRAFQEALFGATPEQQRELMTYYPALGSDAVAHGERGEESVRDQATAGLTRLTDEDHVAFEECTAMWWGPFTLSSAPCSDAAGSGRWRNQRFQLGIPPRYAGPRAGRGPNWRRRGTLERPCLGRGPTK